MLCCLAACVFHKCTYGHKAVVTSHQWHHGCDIEDDATPNTISRSVTCLKNTYLWLGCCRPTGHCPEKSCTGHLVWYKATLSVKYTRGLDLHGWTLRNQWHFPREKIIISPPVQEEHDRVLMLHIHSTHMGVDKRKNRVRDFLFWHNKVNRGSSGSQWNMPRAMWCETQRALMVAGHPH